jgi:hypothetical protein
VRTGAPDAIEQSGQLLATLLDAEVAQEARVAPGHAGEADALPVQVVVEGVVADLAAGKYCVSGAVDIDVY